MSNTVLLTHDGFEKLTKECAELKEKKRKRALDRLKKAREMGDLSENSEYTAAKEELSLIDARIGEIEELLKKAQIVNHTAVTQKVEIGSQATVENHGQREVYTIVGDLEADIAEKKLSHTSPLGKALMGKKIGDELQVRVPAGVVHYKIIAIQ